MWTMFGAGPFTRIILVYFLPLTVIVVGGIPLFLHSRVESVQQCIPGTTCCMCCPVHIRYICIVACQQQLIVIMGIFLHICFTDPSLDGCASPTGGNHSLRDTCLLIEV